MDPKRPAIRAWLASELRPMPSMKLSTGVLTIQAKPPSTNPTIQKPSSVAFLPKLIP